MGKYSLGRKSNKIKSEEEKQQRKNNVYVLYTTHNKNWDQIMKATGCSRSTIFNIRNELIREGKLEKTATGFIRKSKAQRLEELDKELRESDFVKKYPSVQRMYDKVKFTQSMRMTVPTFFVVVRTLGVPPDAFLQGLDEVQRLFDKFVELFKAGKAEYIQKNNKMAFRFGENTSVRVYATAVAKFCDTNNQTLPRGLTGNLSRKKENYGVYNTIQFSDQEFLKMQKWFLEQDNSDAESWARLFTLAHDSFCRPSTICKYKYNFVEKLYAVDNIKTMRLADHIFEKKQQRKFPKWIFRKESLDLLKNTPNKELDYPFTIKMKKFADLLRTLYDELGKIEKGTLYNKGAQDAEKFYLSEKPIHSLRHSGCHFFMRSSGYNATIVQQFGWDDPTMITKVYAGLDEANILSQGVCYYCDPPQQIIKDNDFVFCSLRHALAYHSSGQSPREKKVGD